MLCSWSGISTLAMSKHGMMLDICLWMKPVSFCSTSWWRHQMETFSALLAICVGNSPVPSEFPTKRPVTPSFDVYFDLRPNNQLSKQPWGWWFETQSRPLWRHRNVFASNDNDQGSFIRNSQWKKIKAETTMLIFKTWKPGYWCLHQ